MSLGWISRSCKWIAWIAYLVVPFRGLCRARRCAGRGVRCAGRVVTKRVGGVRYRFIEGVVIFVILPGCPGLASLDLVRIGGATGLVDLSGFDESGNLPGCHIVEAVGYLVELVRSRWPTLERLEQHEKLS